jgi:hypothetical protein
MRGDGGPRDLHLDEEYMRNVLCIAEGTQDHPVARALYERKVVRSFRRSLGLAASVVKTTRFTELKTEGGSFRALFDAVFLPRMAADSTGAQKNNEGAILLGQRRAFTR